MTTVISFAPFNYFKDDVSPIKHVPYPSQEETTCAP